MKHKASSFIHFRRLFIVNSQNFILRQPLYYLLLLHLPHNPLSFVLFLHMGKEGK